MIGKKFGRLTVLEELSERKNGGKVYKCVCECGKYIDVRGAFLRNGQTKSCGCLMIDTNTKHSKYGTRIYNIYYGIIQRCYNTNAKDHYPHYGGRGIIMCDEWKHDFMSFYDWAISHGYKEGLTIDRIDNNGNYEPSNCRWVTVYEQNKNRSNSILVHYNNMTKSITEWIKTLVK